MSIEDCLQQTANILTQTVTQDAAGGAVREPYALVQPGVACLVKPNGGKPIRKDGKLTDLRYHRIYFLPEDLLAPLSIKNRIAITDGLNVVRAYVVESIADVNSMGRLLQVDCSEQPL